MDTGLLKFGEFELDCARYEVRRAGRAVKLEKIPLDLLILLAESGGRLVTREEIEEKVWGKEVFVDAEHGINTAIRKIRQALGDDAEEPKFIQTVQRKGYRFVAEVERLEPGRVKAAGEREPRSVQEKEEASLVQIPNKKLRWVWGLAVVLVLLTWPVAKFVAPRLSRADKKAATIRSIAVLPLENISGEEGQEAFADGMTDELITMLAKYPKMRVISRTSVMQYKKVHRALPEIARELGVDGVIEGTVTRSGGRVRVRAQLIYAPTDTHLWAESYDRDLGDVLSLQQELARHIAERVNLATSPAGDSVRAALKPLNLEARDAYYKGRSYWSVGQYEKSEGIFKEAIRLEPNYAAAYAGLADAYVAEAVSGHFRPRDVIAKGEAAVQKALEIDDSEAQVHHSLAGVKLFFRWDWEGAELESKRAIELNPGLAELHHLHAYVLEARNQVEESLQEDKLCVELDPFGRYWAYAFALYRARRYEEAIKEIKERAEVRGNWEPLYELLGLSYAHLGEYSEAVEAWKKPAEEEGRQEAAKELENTFHEHGFAGVMELRYRLQKEEVKKHYVSQINLAQAAAGANHKAEALTFLEKAYDEHEPLMVRLLHNPAFDELHEEPRFRVLVKKMGLPGGI